MADPPLGPVQPPQPQPDISAFGTNFGNFDPVAQATQGAQGALAQGATPTPGTTVGAPEQQQIAAQPALQTPEALQAQENAQLTAAENTLQGQFAADEAKLDKRFKTAEEAANQYVAQYTEYNKGFVARENQLFAQAEAERERQAQAKEEQAAELKTDADRLQDFAAKTPTRQAAYAAAMHTTPLLAILAAIGGAATRTSALGMLGATNGIVQGVNQGAENNFSDAVNQWRAKYDAMKEHMDAMQKYWGQLSEAYGERADGREKAADHARTAFQDALSPAQLKMSSSADLLKEQAGIINQLENHKIAWEKILEQRAIRSGAANMASEQTLRYLANWALDTGNLNQAVSMFGRGQNTFAARQSLIDKMQQVYAERHGGNPEYSQPGGAQKLATDAAQYTYAIAQNNLGISRAIGAAGRQAGNIMGAANDMVVLLPQLQAAAMRVGQRNHWKKWNEMVTDLRLQAQDPDVALLVEQMSNFMQDWNIVGARGSGRSTGPEREDRANRLSVAYNTDTFLTLLNGAVFDAFAAKQGYGEAMAPGAWDPNAARVMPVPQYPQLPMPQQFMYGVPGGLPSSENAPPGGMPGPFPGGVGGFPAQPGYQPGAAPSAPRELGPEWRDVH